MKNICYSNYVDCSDMAYLSTLSCIKPRIIQLSDYATYYEIGDCSLVAYVSIGSWKNSLSGPCDVTPHSQPFYMFVFTTVMKLIGMK